MHVRASRALGSILSRTAYAKYSENSPLVTPRLPAFGDRFRTLGHPVPGFLEGFPGGIQEGFPEGFAGGFTECFSKGSPESFPEG